MAQSSLLECVYLDKMGMVLTAEWVKCCDCGLFRFFVDFVGGKITNSYRLVSED